MRIIGNGFLARHLQAIEHLHRDVTVLAAGVPRQDLAKPEHDREIALVRNMIVECKRNDRMLVFFSSAGVYDGSNSPGREDKPIFPSTPYGLHKLNIEHFIQESGVRHLTLRLCYVLGPYAPSFRLIPSLIQQIRSGTVRVYTDAHRDLLHVADVVMILRKLLDARLEREVVNVASGNCVHIDQIIEHIQTRLGLAPALEHIGRGTTHCLSVEKLHYILPELRHMGFGPTYYQTAIDRYLKETGEL